MPDTGQPGDEYEQEADVTADIVMRKEDRAAGTGSFFKPAFSRVQRACDHCEEEEGTLQRKESGSGAGASVAENYLGSLNGKGSPLAQHEKTFFEPRMGYDFSRVRLHTDTSANASAQHLHALAYTNGNNIVFAPNQYQPGTDTGKRLLAHELTHVVQQSGTKSMFSGENIQQLNEPAIQPQRVQRAPDAGPAEKKVFFNIYFTVALTREQFIDLAERTIYGRRMPNITWEKVKEKYTPADSPVRASVPSTTLQQRLGDYGESVGKVISNLNMVQDAATYQRLNRIIQKMTPAQWADYEKRVTGKSDNLDDFEKSVDAYLASRQQREAELGTRDKLIQKLYGLEPLYEAYKKGDWLFDATALQTLTDKLKASNFPGGIPDFEKFIDDYQVAFRTETVKIGLDILAQYDSVLYKEGLRYQNPAEVQALYQQLAPMRTEYAAFEKNAAVYNDFQREEADRQERSRIPGNGGLAEPSEERKAAAAAAGAEAQKHREAARQAVGAISDTFPVLKEDQLPLNRRLDKAAMAKADPGQLMALLKAHIDARREDIKKTTETLISDPEKIYTLDKLLEASKDKQQINPKSIFGLIIQDKASSIKRTDIIIGVLVAVFAIALTIVSLGTGVVAAGAAVAAFGLSSVMAYQEFKKYETEHAAYGAGMLSDDPSLVWVIVAIVGAAIDLGQAVKAVKAISPLAKALDASKDLSSVSKLAEFNKGIKALEKSGEIDAKIARSAEQAALARTKAAEAAKSLADTLGSRAYSFPGPLLDPDVYRDVVKLAFYKIKEGGLAFQQFALEVRQARIAAKMADFSPEELVLLKRAYEEGKAFATEAELIKYAKKLPLNGKSIVLDENILIARDKVAKGLPLQEGEKRMIEYLNANPNAKLTVPEDVYDKVVGKIDTSDLTIVETTSKAGSAEYDSVTKVLETNKVGATKGVEDRKLIADTLFARTEPGVTPTFVTHDAGIYKKLYMLGKTDPDALKKLGKSVAEAFPGGFDVVINGKTLKVIPVK